MSVYTTVANLQLLLSRDKILDLAYDKEMGGIKDIADPTVIAVLDEVIAQATEEINTYILPVHTVPIGDIGVDFIPERIIEVTGILAIYKLYGRRLHASTSNPMKDRYDECIDWLKMLAKGGVRLQFGEAPDSDIKVANRIRTNADSTKNPKEFGDNW